jgi:hypothetical protein
VGINVQTNKAPDGAKEFSVGDFLPPLPAATKLNEGGLGLEIISNDQPTVETVGCCRSPLYGFKWLAVCAVRSAFIGWDPGFAEGCAETSSRCYSLNPLGSGNSFCLIGRVE